MQIPLRTTSSLDEYIATQEWRRTQLPRCPLHPEGGCSLQRHGSYARRSSRGVRIARWYCPQGGMTFSLLPDFLAARLPGLLMTIEQTAMVARSARSMEAAADALRGPEIGLAGALRWLRRRLTAVHNSIAAAKLFVPDILECKVTGGGAPILPNLRRTLPLSVLSRIPAPLGFASVAITNAGSTHALCTVGTSPDGTVTPVDGAGCQHDMGPDGMCAAGYAASVTVKEIGYRCVASRMPRPPPRRLAVPGAAIVD